MKRVWCALVAVILASPAFAQMTENNVLNAVPVPGTVQIDGKLDDWDLSGKILCCADLTTMGASNSATVAMMYDAEALYVGIDWIDFTPMVNNYDPQFDRRFCFHSDSVQLHFKTDQIRQVFGWYFTKGQSPAVCVTDEDNWYAKEPIVYIDGLKTLGITEAFQLKSDGKGYVQEMRIPWAAIVKSGTAYKPGEKFECMIDLVWGPDAGKGWPVAHCMDLVKPGAAHGDWFWNVRDIRGQVLLSPQGNLKLEQRTYAAQQKAKPQGAVPVRMEIPSDAKRFTMAINDAQGQRVRNLAGDFIAQDFTVAEKDGKRTVEVNWDCLDDYGKPVSPGTFKVIGLTQDGLGAVYEMHYYNPGTPSWETRDGGGAWGADHTPPHAVTAVGDWVSVCWSGAEGGSGVIGIAPDGKKKWGALKGVTALAGDDQHVYTMTSDSWAKTSGLARLAKADGAYQPFTVDGKSYFPLPLEKVFGEQVPGKIVAMAAQGGKLVLAMSEGEIVVLDASSARIVSRSKVAKPRSIAFTKSGDLIAILDGKVYSIAMKEASAQPAVIDLPGIGTASAVTLDGEGHIAVADVGPDSQIKVFDGSKLLYAAGKKGGRPIRGAFDEQAMLHMNSIAFDAQGQLWVVESGEYPRRVSVWGRDGKLVRDYIGNTAYSGSGCYLHEQDPTLAYTGPMEFKLDKEKMTAKLTQILWVRGEGESFSVDAGSATNAQRFTSSASGQPREYLFEHGGAQVVFMPRNGGWQPVAAVCLVQHISGRLNNYDNSGKTDVAPSGEFAGMNLRDGLIWNDKNKDGKVTLDECIVIKADGKKDGHGPAAKLAVGSGWGGRIGTDLSIFCDGMVRYKPAGFTDDGAPIYDQSSIQDMGLADRGNLVPVTDEHLLIVCSDTGYGRTSYIRGIDTNTNKEVWRYPSRFHGVHGSHNAGMPEPGDIFGAIKVLGVARINDQVGSVFDVRGNIGQDFLVTTDGLFVGALFRDCRIPTPPLPATEKELQGKRMDDYTEGAEPFNGWFGKQSDGKVRMINGMAGQAGSILQIVGLDSIRRVTGGEFTVDAPTIIKAEEQNVARVQAAAAKKTYAIRSLSRKPFRLGAADNWAKDYPVMTLDREGSPNNARVRIGYDQENLYVHFQVNDPTPMLNEGKDYTRLFKTGDAVDLQFNIDPAAKDPKRTGPLASDVRIVFSKMSDGKAVAVLMKPIDAGAPADRKVKYTSPVGAKSFDRVEVLPDVQIKLAATNNAYTLEAAIPLKSIGLSPKSGMVIRGDAGIISSDAAGLSNVARTYWSNKQTNLVSDLPFEAWLYPAAWGEWTFE